MPRPAGVVRVGCYFAGMFATAVSAPMMAAQAPIPSGVIDQPAVLGDAKGPAVGWGFGMDVGGRYDSNVLFASPDDPGDAVSQLHANLTGTLHTRRASLSVTGDGSSLLYRQLHDLNQFTYQVGATGTYDVSPRLTAHIDGSERTSLSTDIAAVGGGLPVLPLALSRTTIGEIQATERLSPRTTASLDGTYTNVDFSTGGLVNGSTAVARLDLSHLIQPDRSIGLTAAEELIDTKESTQWLESAEASTLGNIGPFVSQLRMGATALVTPGQRTNVVPTGGVDMRYGPGRGMLELSYAHGLNEVFGLGAVFVTDAVDLSYTQSALAGFSVRLGADQSWGAYATGPSESLDATGGTIQIRHTLPRNAWIGVGGYVRRRIQGNLVSGEGASLSAGFAVGP
jgi:hypothetical protein